MSTRHFIEITKHEQKIAGIAYIKGLSCTPAALHFSLFLSKLPSMRKLKRGPNGNETHGNGNFIQFLSIPLAIQVGERVSCEFPPQHGASSEMKIFTAAKSAWTLACNRRIHTKRECTRKTLPPPRIRQQQCARFADFF